MKRRVLIALMVVAAAAGCSKSDILEPNTYLPGGNAIAFSDSPETRGDIVENTAALDEMDIYAYYTANTKWADAGKDEVSKFMNNQLIKKNASDEWSYSPVKYWSNNDGDMFSFFAFSPYGAISVTHNANDKPVFNYTLQPSASDNDDLLAAVQYNKQKSIDAVNLPFKHALTRISLKGKVSGTIPTNVRYMVESIEFHSIRPQGKLQFDESGNISWAIDNSIDPITYTATRNRTLPKKSLNLSALQRVFRLSQLTSKNQSSLI